MADAHAPTSHNHPTPQQRLVALLSEDRADLVVLVTYVIVTALLGLATPIAVQALVNAVAAGMVQPLLMVSLLVFAGLAGVGVLSLLQLSLVERLQQRLFARSALRMAERLIRATSAALHGKFGPELVNRFFDVLTIQKSLAKLLLDGLAAAIQAIIGLVLLALFDQSGLLAEFELGLLVVIGLFVMPFGIGGLRTSLAESAEKYRVAGWLEELARCHTSFKLHAAPAFLHARVEAHVVRWLTERRRHFSVTWRQEAVNQVFQTIATTGTLVIGGWLVVQNRLSLGQLVAAQLLIAQVLKSVDKLLKQAEVFYDLLTGLDKTGYITDLAAEPEGGKLVPSSASGGAAVRCQDLRFAYPGGREVLLGMSFTLAAGERVSLVGASGAGKSTIASLLSGLEDPSHGLLEINGQEIHGADRGSLRQVVSVVGYENALFDGTLEENIVCGRDYLTTEQVRWALELACLIDDIALLPDGLQTRLVSGGGNLSQGQAQRILLARATVDRPELLILDEAFTEIDERMALKVLDNLFDPANGWTILDIAHLGAVVTRADRVLVLDDGRIVESGSPAVLAAQKDSAFARLFPGLCEGIVAQ